MAHRKTQGLIARPIDRQAAARAFLACAGRDPEARATPASAAAAGECFTLTGPGGTVALSVSFAGPVAWVNAAAGGGGGMAGEVLAEVESLAAQRGCHRIGFQTLRAGLQRLAVKRGYVVTQRIGHGVKLMKNL